ncbi:MAG TPA: hypothetical protein DCW74_14605 [Alteromonas australica]|uniref:Uncharacterized protein n=1 Tax=Alteromonas australica TaxID=589873 RepID=A0A350P6N4_9ALTE|nr:hypothetical protein [Alteromonas australica]MAF69541.1 hypothetical protein [Alteromonas sp.]HAU28427.1 hypothetical protein [Alteromonas australica]HAW76951.1 hypothetical protein [Alteromonas australica]
MKSTDLNHPYTPSALRDINEKITAQLADISTADFSEINRLIKERDIVIRAHLNDVHGSAKEAFANHELDVNNKLKDLAQKLRDSTKDEVTRIVRGKAAIKKYK